MNIQVKRIVTGPFKETTYLVWNKGDCDCQVVDLGNEGLIIMQFLNNTDMKPVAIVITNAYLDHIGVVQDLKMNLGYHFYIKMKIAC